MYLRLKNSVVPILFLVICGLGIYLRILHIHKHLWLDELATSWVVSGSFSDIFDRCWVDNLSPLFFIITYISKAIVGYTEFALRMPCLLSGILTIPLVFLFTYKLSASKTLSLLAAFLSSIDSALIFYSDEARPYALVIFFSLLHLYIFIGFLQKKKKLNAAVILGFLSGIIILLHYTAAIICVVELFIAIIYFYQQRILKQNIIWLSLYALIPAIIMLPFLWHILYLFNNNHVLGTCISKEGLYSIFVIHPQLISLVLLPLIVGTFVEYAAKKIIFPGANKSFILFFLLSWYFLPLLINWALTKLNVATVYSPRYLSWIIPAPIIGSALLISAFQSKWSKFAYIFTLLVLATQFYIKDILTIIVTERNQNETAKYESNGNPDFDWKEAVSKINSSGLLTDKIFVISGLVEYQNLNKKGHEKVELANYLLSTVNSMYKLQKEYLEKAEPKGSILEIPDSASNYIVVGPSALTRDLIKTSEYRKNSQIGTEISPFLAPIVIYYKMN